MDLGSCSRYADWAIGWTVRGSNLGRDNRFISSQICPVWLFSSCSMGMRAKAARALS